MNKKAALHNLGCKVNAYEVEAMQQLLEEAGYEIVPFEPGADVYVINTCTVTNIADRKSRQMLHKAKKMNPDAIVVATGCYVQTDTEKLDKDEAVDLILGNNQKKNIVEALEDYEKEHHKLSRVIKINQTKEYESLAISRTAEHVRAYMKVQDGCNQFCTYCIIPYARGRVRSRDMENVLEEARTLAETGYQEVVLTGIHLSSYGVDFPEDKKADLLTLIEAVHKIEGIKRIRLGSLEPGIITEDFVQRLAAVKQICPHFHLSLQSGCEATLKRMNRHYTPEDYAARCGLLEKYFDRPAFTTDVIVGFPGETEDEFVQTEKFLEQIHFAEMHIFKYSPRKGTRAAVMPEQVNEQEKTLRSSRLLKLAEKMSEDYREKCRDKVLEVLVEERISADGEWVWTGHSKEYIKCGIKSDKVRSKDIIRCRMTSSKSEDFVFCEIID